MVHWNNQEIEGAIMGGIFISVATTLNYFLYGRNEGMHKILKGIFKQSFRGDLDSLLKICFIFGVVTVPFLTTMGLFSGEFNTIESFTFFGKIFRVFDKNEVTVVNLNALGWLIAGFLIGMGMKISKGCTGGHAYCSSPLIT